MDDAAPIDKLVRLSGGSPGLAQVLADPALGRLRRRLLEVLAGRPFDAVGLAGAWMGIVEEAGKESAAQRARSQLVLRLLIDFLNDGLALALGGCPRRTEPEDRPALEALAGHVEADVLLEVLERCTEAEMQIDRRVQLILVVEGLLDALAQKLR
jgi:hypothetical protein